MQRVKIDAKKLPGRNKRLTAEQFATAKKPQPVNWSSFTKAELIRTIKTLHRRQTTLLNQIAKLERIAASRSALVQEPKDAAGAVADRLPDWQDTNQDAVRADAVFPWQQS